MRTKARTLVSIVVAFVLLILVLYIAYSGNIILPDYWTQLAVALTAIALGVLYWGFEPQINSFLKGKADLQGSKVETTTKEETNVSSINQRVLMRDEIQITKLKVDNHFLDKIYEEARNKATEIFPDAKLSYFSIQVRPYDELFRVNIFLDFYSKWADKICSFASYNSSPETNHLTPDKRAFFPFRKQVFINPPWKESPHWQQFVEKAYARIEPLTPAKDTIYHLSAKPHMNKSWILTFCDGFSGRENSFEWDGKGLDESSIIQLR